MAIVQVNPRRQQQQIQRQQISPLDKNLDRLLKGLTIANQGYGIAVNMQRIEDMRAAQARQPTPEQAQQQIQQGLSIGQEQLRTQKATTGLRQAQMERERITTPTPEQAQQTFKLAQQQKQLDIQEQNARIRKLESEIASPKKTVDLRKEWKSDPTTKATQSGKVAIDKIRAVATGEPDAAKDHSMIFNYMKTVDPGSTVKEGEFATIEQAGGAFDRFTIGLFNKTLEGQMLTPTQRQQFLDVSENLWQQQVNAQQQLNSEYTRLANAQGIPANQVVLDLGLQGGQQQQQQPQFSEQEIKAVMDATGEGRGEAILRLKSALGQ
jgi:hypothetical protein